MKLQSHSHQRTKIPPAKRSPDSPALIPAAFAGLSTSPWLPTPQLRLMICRLLQAATSGIVLFCCLPGHPARVHTGRFTLRWPEGTTCMALGTEGSLSWRIEGAGSCDQPIAFACDHFKYFLSKSTAHLQAITWERFRSFAATPGGTARWCISLWRGDIDQIRASPDPPNS